MISFHCHTEVKRNALLFPEDLLEISCYNTRPSLLLSLPHVMFVGRVNDGGGDGWRGNLNHWSGDDHYGSNMRYSSLA